jgi:hypothetical protein
VLLANVSAIDWALLPRAVMGLLALLCGNGYIVGINQIYDVDIDAVNKPFLPVAAGRLAGRRDPKDAVQHREPCSRGWVFRTQCPYQLLLVQGFEISVMPPT